MPTAAPTNPSQRYQVLMVATAILAANFCAWSIISPLAKYYSTALALSPGLIAFILAAPVMIGSIGRIVIGLATDRFGGHLLFTLLCWFTIIPVLLLLIINSYVQLLLAAILLGVAGTSFAIGVPYLSAWFPASQRGLALGIYGMGNAGTAMAGIAAPQLWQWWGQNILFITVAVMLLIAGIASWRLAPNPPHWTPATKGTGLERLRLALVNWQTWDLALVYAISFGAFVSFALYLPVMLNTWYELSVADAATRAAGFIVLATVTRPIGGWLSDRWGGRNVIRLVLLVVVVLALAMASQQALTLTSTIIFLAMAATLGCGSGAVIALASRVIQPAILGGANGVIGAVGGLGGFLPPLILGFTYQTTGSYTAALLLLAVITFIIFIYISYRFRSYPPTLTTPS